MADGTPRHGADDQPNRPSGSTRQAVRRERLRRSRWVAAGIAVGTASLLTGVIAAVDGTGDGQQITSVDPGGAQSSPRTDDVADELDDVGSARPFDPRAEAPSGSSAQDPSSGSPSAGGTSTVPAAGGPQTRSGGS